jgi:hypothetical protein
MVQEVLNLSVLWDWGGRVGSWGFLGRFSQNDLEMVKLSVRGRYGTLEDGFGVASLILYL